MTIGSPLARASALACLVSISIANAQDSHKTDESGTVMHVTTWHDIPARELVINIVDLPDVKVARVQQRSRDNRAIHQWAGFDTPHGWLRIQYFADPGYTLGEHAGEATRDGTRAKRWAKHYWAAGAEPFDYEEERKIYAFGERGGWAYMTRGRHASRRCILAAVAFLSDGSKGSSATFEVYDTGVIFRDCSGKRTLDETAEWLGSLKIVSPDYTPPTVRLATGATADDRLHTMNAVRLVNSALPADWQLRVDDTPAIRDGKLNPGFIEVAFDRRERWPSGVSTADRVGVALTRFTGSGEITAAGILIDPTLVRGERARMGVLLHELLHTLGRGHVDPRAFPDTLMHAYGLRSADWIHMHPLDDAALYAVYDRLRPGESGDLGLNDLGPWNEVSTHVMGRYGQPGSRVLFGAAWRHGQPRPWAILPDPSPPMRTRPSGSASWSGRLLGLTPRAEAVSGAMDMSLRLSTLRGSLDFTDMEKWAPHAVPGALGTGSRWGDGDLRYGIAVAQGRFITETGGDEGQITGVFSGPRHERVGGTLRRDDLAAGFGGKR